MPSLVSFALRRLLRGLLTVWFAVTVLLTFVVPRVERPGWTHGEDYQPAPPVR